MKLIYILFCALFLSNVLLAQNLKPVDLSKVIKEQNGDKSLRNIMFFYTNNQELKRLNLTKYIKEQKFLDYVKDKFNLLYIDTRKYQELASYYEFHTCPIAIITDSQGVELSRLNTLISRDFGGEIDKRLEAGFTFPDRENKFKANREYGAKYAYHMSLINMPDAARRILTEMLNAPIQKRFFITKGRTALYRLIETLDDPLLMTLKARKNEICKMIGKDEYADLMHSLSSHILILSKRQATYDKNMGVFYDVLSKVNQDKILSSDYSQFLAKNMDVLLSDDINLIQSVFTKDLKRMDDFSIIELTQNLSSYIPSKFQKENSEFFISLFQRIAERSKNYELQLVLMNKIKNLKK